MKLYDKLDELKREGGKLYDIIITADTVCSLDGKVIEKAESDQEAEEMLMFLSGKTHQVITNVWIAFVENNEIKKLRNTTDVTQVTFDTLNKEMIAPYIASGTYRGKSGAYGIQGEAATFVREIKGCFFSVWGLPINKFTNLLREMITQDLQTAELGAASAPQGESSATTGSQHH